MSHPLLDNNFPTTVAKDFFKLMATDRLGYGAAREVYACGPNTDLVIKIENIEQSFQNVHEWDVWQEVRDTEFARWFAPCTDISSCGIVLLQHRTKPATRDQFPAKMPSFFTDTKRSNYGMLEGRLVCHDYGVTLLRANGLVRRMRTAKWWDEEE